MAKPTYEELEKRIKELEKRAKDYPIIFGENYEKNVQQILPSLDNPEDILFEDLFNLKDIQRLQDEFSNATGVASIITQTDGTPITKPSNFCRLCSDIIRTTEKGRINCFKSDALIGRYHQEGPMIQPCQSGGLWDAGAGISVGGKHIANWLIGQVRDETQTGDKMREYAREIDVDETQMLEAFEEVPSMSLDQFKKIAKMLFTMAEQLSKSAYLNVQQMRFITERQLVEKQLTQSEEKYRALVESSSDFIWEVDENGTYTYVSPKVKDVLGYSQEEVTGKTPFDFMPEHVVDQVGSQFKAAVDKGRPIKSLENENIHKDGKSVILETSGVPVFDSSGNLKGYRGVARDITKGKTIEKELFEKEARFRQIFENIDVGIAIYETPDDGENFIFKDINPYGAKSGELSREGHIGHNVLEIYPSVNEMGIFDVFQEVWETGISKNHPISKYQDGRVTLWVENYVTKLPSGEIMAVYQDVTAERKAEAALRSSEKRLRQSLDATPFPIAMTGLDDDKILFWSHSALDLFGHIAETVSEWYEVAYPDPEYRQFVIAKWESYLEGARKSGKPVNTGEYKITCKDGSKCICEVYATFLKKNLIVTFNDITRQKNFENELKEHQEHLEKLVENRTIAVEKKNKELEMFTYSVSHDLKAPLRGIDGYSRLLVEEYADKLDEEGLSFLKNVRTGTTQMNKLIEDLLAYSRMERKDLHLTTIDMNSLIENLLGQKVHDIEQCRIKVTVDLPFQTIKSDTETLRQVLANYLDNAIKYSKKDTSGTVTIGGCQDDDYWTVWVKDTGIGFDPKYLDRIFEIFQRLHRVEEYPGTGVGLAIVRKAVERIGGRVRADSTPGKGATFYLDIPKNNPVTS